MRAGMMTIGLDVGGLDMGISNLGAKMKTHETIYPSRIQGLGTIAVCLILCIKSHPAPYACFSGAIQLRYVSAALVYGITL